jgi:hypothetical protein
MCFTNVSAQFIQNSTSEDLNNGGVITTDEANTDVLTFTTHSKKKKTNKNRYKLHSRINSQANSGNKNEGLEYE